MSAPQPPYGYGYQDEPSPQPPRRKRRGRTVLLPLTGAAIFFIGLGAALGSGSSSGRK
ncbi:MAG: hypothetical protein ACRDNZ_17730 [Streptosporangiaceae bacterium]